MAKKLANIRNTDHLLRQTYKITGGFKTKIPILQDKIYNSIYTNEEKLEGLARNLKNVHTHAQHSPIEEDIEHKPTLPTLVNYPFCTPKTVKNIIKNFPNNRAPEPDKVTAIKLKNLPTKPIVQLYCIYYIYKACLKLAYFSMTWKMAKVIPIPKLGKSTTNT